jgi:hypothetical protein
MLVIIVLVVTMLDTIEMQNYHNRIYLYTIRIAGPMLFI